MKRILITLLIALLLIGTGQAAVDDMYTKLLHHFDGASGVSPTAANASPEEYGQSAWICPNAFLNTTNSKLGNASVNFSTLAALAPSYCRLTPHGQQHMNIFNYSLNGYPDYTIEFFLRRANRSVVPNGVNTYIYTYTDASTVNGYILMYANFSPVHYVYSIIYKDSVAVSQTNCIIGSGTPLSDTAWQHFVFTRRGNIEYAYWNGTLCGQSGAISNYPPLQAASEYVYVGMHPSLAGGFNGSMDELRVSRKARYTGATTMTPGVPTANFNSSFWNYTTPGTYYWTAPPDVTNITLNMAGAGGSGMGAMNQTGYASGNGGHVGSWFNLSHIPVTPGQTYTLTVGDHGATSLYNSHVAETGGVSTAFGFTADGGLGGEQGTVAATPPASSNGGAGESTFYLTTGTLAAAGTYYGGTGGLGYGAGGGGGGTSGTTPCSAGNGGEGAPGVIRIWADGVQGENTPDFTASPTAGATGTTITFTDTSTIWDTSGMAYVWDWGDGTPTSSSQEPQVQHIYASPGSYSPSLTISNTYGSFKTVKENYILISGADTTTWYSPSQVRFTVLDYLGNNVVGATVNATYDQTTLPAAALWLSTVYGIDPAIAASMLTNNTVMSGTTGSDGATTFTMHSSLKYNVSVWNASTFVSTLLYPKEFDYNIWLPKPTVNNTYAQIGYNLTFVEPNASYYTMGMVYQDNSSLTQRVTFYVNATNGTIINYTTIINPGTTALSVNKTIMNLRGESYYWGLKVVRSPTHPEGGNISMDRGVSSKGASGVLIDLRLPNTSYYPWIALFLLFLVTSLASKGNVRFMVLIVPILAAFFWWFGWLSGTYLASVVPFACLLGAVYYMKGSLRENYGVGGSGSMLINIVVFMIILQMMVGFISSLGVFNQSAMATPYNEFSNVDLTTIRNETSNFGGINDPLQSANNFATIGWATMKIALNMIGAVFVVGIYLIEMFPYIPPGFFMILQGGIYVLYVLFIVKLIGKAGSEVDL